MPDVPLHINLDTDAVTASVLKAVHLDVDAIRAEVAEGIAKCIEELAEACGEDEEQFKVAYSVAAEVARIVGARGYTLAGQDPADRQEA